ncbi:activating transcription factor 7-interacting protein 1 isoform X2 [Silurus meridionalis]|uniref:activating transcription factor 7-interacting protein 1 isoform X2 n=1 Tax=Silurus meridionalis TaxID=175797 RepID=UPI001EEBF1B6|nr:activating transcription factor 7-interacting protein 1 isoform X2 [Silurus meridionalis]
MEVAVPEEPQKKIFRARKTMKMSDRQQLEVLHNTLVTANPNSSSQPQTPLVNGTHGEDGLKGKEKDKESGTKSPVLPLSRSSPIPSLSRSPSPSVRDAQNSSPSLKKCSEKSKGEDKKGEQDRKDDKKAEEVKADKLEIVKSAHPGSPSGSDKKIEHKKSTTVQVLNGELPVDSDSTSLDNGSAEEKSSKSIFSSSPSGSPAASLECDPEVKEGFLCLSEEDEGQGEQDEAKDKNEEKMDVDPEKEENKEGERGCNVADGTGTCTTGKKRSLSPVEGKAGEPKEERDGKRARVEGVQLEAQLELKITANAGSRLKLEKVVQQLVEERLRMLQMTVFDCNLQELKDRMEKIDAATKQQKTVQHTLQSKIARLTKKFGAANQASENFKKVQEAAAKPTLTPTTVPTMQRNVRTTLDPKPSTLSAGSNSTATPTQPKPHSTPSTPTSSAVATPAPILQLITTTTNSTPSSSSSSLSGQASTLLLQQRPNTGAMTTSTVTSAGQPMSIQPLLIQLPLAMANGQGGTLAGGVGLIPVSSLGTVTSLSKAKTTTATTFILQKTSGSVVTTSSSAPPSLISSATSAVTQMPPSRPIYQGGTGTANSPNAGISVTTARAPAQCATVVGMATASSSPASTGPAATGSAAAAAAGPPSASETASKTDNQAIHSAPAKSSAQTRRNAYDAAFKLMAINLAVEKGNRAAARELGLNESMMRRWKQQHEELIRCKKTTKAFRGKKSRWPELENELEDWVNAQRADGRGVSNVQIRLKAKAIATAMKFEDFRGGPSWCLRFMRRKGLSIRARTTLCQQLPPDYEEKVSNFSKFTHAKIAEHSIGPHDIINMDEVPLTFDLPLTRTVYSDGESVVTLTPMHFTCVLSCTASGEKLPPMVIFKRMTMPEDKLPRAIVVKVNKKGWMTESLMNEWLTQCYGKRLGGFSHRNKALLVLDSMRAHITDSVKEAIKRTNSLSAVIPHGTTKYLQPLDISVNRAFKVALRGQWEDWMTSEEKSFTETNRMQRATYGQICQWILTAWRAVKKSSIINGFRKAGLLHVEEGSTSLAEIFPPDENESDNENNPEKTSNEAILGLFNSDTEDDDFSGFSEQEDEDSDFLASS